MSVTLHHVVEGPSDAPVVVLGNSLGTSLGIWGSVAAALHPDLRVIRYDHRGQGGSQVVPGPCTVADLGGDLVALLDALGVERVTYCGVSLGGMVGLWLAAQARASIEALVVFCTSARPGNADMWAERARVVTGAGGTGPIVDAVVSGWVTPGFALAHPEVVGELREMLLASPPLGYVAGCQALQGLDLRDDLGEIRAPTLVVSGAQDEFLPPKHGEQIAANIPGARFELLDPAAHIPMVERPDAVAGLILEHLGIEA